MFEEERDEGNAPVGGAGDPLFGSGVVAAVVGDDGSVLRWSEAAEALLGYRAEEVCGIPFAALVEEDPSSADGPWRSPVFWSSAGMRPGDDAPPVHRLSLRHAGGGILDTVCWVLRMGHEHLVLALPADITLLWREGVALTQALFRQNRVGAVLYDTGLTVVRSNITPDVLGGPSVPVGSRLGTVAEGEGARDLVAGVRKVLETGIPLVGRERPIRFPASGHEWAASTTALRTEDSMGRPTGVLVMVSDITEQYRARRHRELLHDSLMRMGSSLDVRRTAEDLVNVLVPKFGDFATVDLPSAVLIGEEPPQLGAVIVPLTRVAGASATGIWPERVFLPGAPWPAGTPDSPTLGRLLQGEVVTLDRAEMNRALGDFVDAYAPPDSASVTAAPLLARGLLLGTVGVWRTAHRAPMDRSEEVLLSEIASAGALGVDNARRYDREHRAAVALQERLLPRATIKTAAVETKGFYRPSGGRAGISGDWFDVISLPSLRVGLVIGDVTGHGLSATAMMGRLRTAIQTIADMELEPSEVLSHIEALVQRLAAETPVEQQDTVGATCLYAVYDPITRLCTMASAGQPPPVVVHPDGRTEFIDIEPGPPLGVGGVPFQSVTLELEADCVLALYTDGLIRAEEYDVGRGLERIRRGLEAHCPGRRELDEVGRALVADGTPAHDDIALLLARTRVVSRENTVSWHFPPDAESVGKAREVTARQLEAWGLDELMLTTELVVSELVTNAIRYAGGPVGLRLIREDVLICEVSDPSSTQPRLLRAEATDEGGRGLFIVAQCTSRWGSRYSPHGKTIWTEQPLEGTRPG